MMLDTDMCLAYQNNEICGKFIDAEKHRDPNCRPGTGTPISAYTGGSCCAWQKLEVLYDVAAFTRDIPITYCGRPGVTDVEQVKGRKDCCESREPADSYGDCERPGRISGVATEHLYDFIEDENYWLESYLVAWNSATENNLEKLPGLKLL